MMPKKLLLTRNEAEKIIKAQKLGQSFVLASFDLGHTTQKAEIEGSKISVGGVYFGVDALLKLKDDACYVLDEDVFRKIEFFGEDTNLFYKLKPTRDWPTLMLSSVPMHRFKHFSPKEDTLSKIKEIAPLKGVILDTCCGLGYTATQAAKTNGVERVIVFERDANVVRICEYNPFSSELFSNKKIELRQESVFDGIKTLSAAFFDRVIHDPPTVSFAPELYSDEFYSELYRVMKKKSVLYHYCPNPGKTKGAEFWRSVEKLLLRNGFVNVKYNSKSSGIRAVKK